MKMSFYLLMGLLVLSAPSETLAKRVMKRGSKIVRHATAAKANTDNAGITVEGGHQNFGQSVMLEAKMGSMVNSLLVHGGGIDESLEASVSGLVMKMLKSQGTTLRQIVETVHDKMDIADAVRRLEGRLPEEVASLVRLTAKGVGLTGKDVGKKVKVNMSRAQEHSEAANTSLGVKELKERKKAAVTKANSTGNEVSGSAKEQKRAIVTKTNLSGNEVSGSAKERKHAVVTKTNSTGKEVSASAKVSVARSLASASHTGSNSEVVAEESMQKARQVLNHMVQEAVADLDKVLIGCKEFEEKNRATFSQVASDIARLGSQVADLERKRVTTNEGIAEQGRLWTSIKEDLEKKKLAYKASRAEKQAELATRKNDLAVFAFILNATRCKSRDGAVLLQMDSPSAVGPGTTDGGLASPRVCNTDSGLTLDFGTPAVQAHFEGMMTPRARIALREALGQMDAPATALLGLGVQPLLPKDPSSIVAATERLLRSQPAHPHSRFEVEAANTSNSSRSSKSPEQAQSKSEKLPVVAHMTLAGHAPEPVQQTPAGAQWKKCMDSSTGCDFLSDAMAMQWGKLKDSVERLEAELDHDADDFGREKANLNEQFAVLNGGKRQMMEVLAETVSAMNLASQERAGKDEQHRDLQKEYKREMAQCRGQVEEILFTNICAAKKVRNAVLQQSKISPPSKIVDCDVKDWVAGQCSVDCDDTCPQQDLHACGGTQMLTRDVIVSANKYGVQCPKLEAEKKCNQIKCPVDCLVSKWSGWSKCSKECEGGVRGRTRSILEKPRNGGQECDAVQEEQVCSTGSCDQDCRLSEWLEWSQCSTACGGGRSVRTKRVNVPIRGMGKCPAKRNPLRYVERDCNMQDCVGDEVCIAKQDLLILLDASGSLKESGFKVAQSFAANLTKRFESKYYGRPAMQVGVVLFGNGHVLSDGTIEPAINVVGLTSDTASVHEAIMGTKWQRGLTNMAQAFVLADTMLQAGRSDAKSSVLVISDGKYGFEFQTEAKVKQLKDRNVNIQMVPIAKFASNEELQKLRSWSSYPAEANFERIPGMDALRFNQEAFVGRCIAKFCSNSVSPTAQRAHDEAQHYMLIREGGLPNQLCAATSVDLGAQKTVDDCASTARARNATAFSFGREVSKGVCKAQALKIDHAWYAEYSLTRQNVPCPKGDWMSNPYFDSYAIKPFINKFA